MEVVARLHGKPERRRCALNGGMIQTKCQELAKGVLLRGIVQLMTEYGSCQRWLLFNSRCTTTSQATTKTKMSFWDPGLASKQMDR